MVTVHDGRDDKAGSERANIIIRVVKDCDVWMWVT